MGKRDFNHRDKFEIISGLYLVLLFLIIFAVAFLSQNNLFAVLLGFFPTVLTVVITLLFYEQYKNNNHFLWTVPLILILLFYFAGLLDTTVLAKMDIEVLTGVNFMLSGVFVVLLVFLRDKGILEGGRGLNKEEAVILNLPKEEQDVETYLHSIEDKSKALNFAIGRVYGKYHGGTKHIREQLRIPSEWYNEVSIISDSTTNINTKSLLGFILRIEDRLSLFEKTEHEVFGASCLNFKNLIRDPHGNDRIITVLDHNDNDPVLSYFEGALEFCKKLRVLLMENKISENKTDDKKPIQKKEEDKTHSENKTVLEQVKDADKEKFERKPQFNHP